jgi:hypothetical protein
MLRNGIYPPFLKNATGVASHRNGFFIDTWLKANLSMLQLKNFARTEGVFALIALCTCGTDTLF